MKSCVRWGVSGVLRDSEFLLLRRWSCVFFLRSGKKRYGFGEWVIAAAVIVGLISAGCGAYRTIREFLREEERRDAQKAAEYSPAVPRRDPNEVWHIPPETPGEQENPQKLE